MTEDENTKVCPYCAETIKLMAIVCRFCGYDLLTGQPTRVLEVNNESPARVPEGRNESAAPIVQARSNSIKDGVKLGFGMFIILPLLFIGAILLLVLIDFLIGTLIYGLR